MLPGTAAIAEAQSSTLSATPVPCGDLLAAARRKPAHVIFTGCRYDPQRQGKPITARYRVEGRFAANVEAQLIKRAGLVRLRRSCCQWDGPPGQFVDGNKQNYTISMVSDETRVASRRYWRKIREFEINVERLTEDI